MKQEVFELPISQRTVLVDVNTVRATRGVDAETIFTQTQKGKLIWVFDVATRLANRSVEDAVAELRFWAKEIIAPETVAKIQIKQVLNQIIPLKRDWFHGTEVAHLLLVSRPTVMRLRQELGGEIVRGSIRVKRAGLVRFFEQRWIGSNKAKEANAI